MHHLDLQITEGLLERRKFIDIFLMESGHGRFPRTQPGTPFFNLFDQRIERLLSLGQVRFVVIRGNANGFDARLRHGVHILRLIEKRAFRILTKARCDRPGFLVARERAEAPQARCSNAATLVT
ncbi:hypothetical protein [Caballeronia sp. LjRoot31]|uniref:hypothetical protein n=1 Tax=Caballeronia sp. LjRoot31 TaxID=3342324 RepID=UPI003F5021E3